MYFVNRKKIEDTLFHMEKTLTHFRSKENWTTPIEMYALERMVHLVIESIIDVGNSMIDGFIMRDPGSYEDIIDILEDEKVVDKSSANALKQVIHCRKALVQDYIELNHEKLKQTFEQSMEALVAFPSAVRRYLNHELGPVSAFLPEEKESEK
ncbi:DUF86 domain-containing protein [Halalkalibacterium ligniniphilum]|uniref:DUF86 domain-containing protein n=1 Tax=Halalkalibacterium ligniniphilum TaxID=1134413 RepID=UPI000344ABE5|nr:DUF86 domain-containing protein [Halalkalibacterium ligniniphilum]